MRIREVFLSCQGEGIYAGVPMVFVRLQGCNLWPGKVCKWCDTEYAQPSGQQKERNIRDIAREVRQNLVSGVCITGGEPLAQEKELGSLVKILINSGKWIEIETNGTLPKPEWWKKCLWSIDYKCPSSGVSKFSYSWKSIGESNQIKFVVADKEDLDFVKARLPELRGPRQPTIIISPMIPLIGDAYGLDTQEWLQEVWNFCVENNLRFSLQLHKIVWGNKKGV